MYFSRLGSRSTGVAVPGDPFAIGWELISQLFNRSTTLGNLEFRGSEPWVPFKFLQRTALIFGWQASETKMINKINK